MTTSFFRIYLQLQYEDHVRTTPTLQGVQNSHSTRKLMPLGLVKSIYGLVEKWAKQKLLDLSPFILTIVATMLSGTSHNQIALDMLIK